MRVLVVGGTQFIGRHVVERLLASGDEVTLLNRGRTGAALFPGVTRIVTDRNGALGELAEGDWEATFDPSAYLPRQVGGLAAALQGRGGRYVHVSSVAAYAPVAALGSSESLPLARLEDPSTEVVDQSTYGGLKALCELEAHSSFGGAGEHPWPAVPVTIVRPTYVAGPHDHTGRFTWWVERLARGGRVVAPGPRASPFQVIDVRDLADFIVKLVHGRASGSFHAVSPAPPFSFEDFLTTAADQVAPAGTELVWVDAERLARAGVTRAELPFWTPDEARWPGSALDPGAAFAAGLAPRPLAETVSELHEHELVEPTPVSGTVGLSQARERELLDEGR